MPIETGQTVRPLSIHATAVAIGGLALVIRGRSRSGKSTLALDLIAASTTALPIHLVGDDRILLRRDDDNVMAAPHPLIAGRIEKRGHGILSVPFVAAAPVVGIVDLDKKRPCDLLGKNFPSLLFVNEIRWERRRFCVCAWFAATSTAHLMAKRRLGLDFRSKDSNW